MYIFTAEMSGFAAPRTAAIKETIQCWVNIRAPWCFLSKHIWVAFFKKALYFTVRQQINFWSVRIPWNRGFKNVCIWIPHMLEIAAKLSNRSYPISTFWIGMLRPFNAPPYHKAFAKNRAIAMFKIVSIQTLQLPLNWCGILYAYRMFKLYKCFQRWAKRAYKKTHGFTFLDIPTRGNTHSLRLFISAVI